MADILNLDSLAEDSKMKPGNCLVGRLFACFKSTDPFAIMDALRKSWNVEKGLEAREWGMDLLLFRFEDAADMSWVITNQPWFYGEYLFLIRPLHQMERPSTVSFTKAQLWARIYDVPVECMNFDVAVSVGSRIGKPICVDMTNLEPFGKFIRVKVELDLNEPLKGGIKVRVGGENGWLPVKYESLPLHCYNCRVMGHTASFCDGGTAAGIEEMPDSLYGSSIKASPTKKSPAPHQKTPSSRKTRKSHCYSK